MSLIKRLFGRAQSQPESNSVLASCRVSADANCWAGSLWWATKALEEAPTSGEARKAFKSAFTNVLAQLFLRATRLEKESQHLNELFRVRKQRQLTDNEATLLADLLARAFYVQLITQQAASLTRRINDGTFDRASSVDEEDLSTGRYLASASADESFPGQRTPDKWTQLLSTEREGAAYLASRIERTEQLLKLIVQPHNAATWRLACQRARTLWSSNAEEDVKMAQILTSLQTVAVSDSDLEDYRAPYEQQFAKMLVRLWNIRDAMRAPLGA